MNKPRNPCKPDCADRTIGCRAHCPRFLHYDKARILYDQVNKAEINAQYEQSILAINRTRRINKMYRKTRSHK